MKMVLSISFILILSLTGICQNTKRELTVKEYLPSALEELRSFMAIPNDALNTDRYYPEHCMA